MGRTDKEQTTTTMKPKKTNIEDVTQFILADNK